MENLFDIDLLDEENNDEAREKFKVKDLDAANWCFRKLKAIEDKKREIKYLADKERTRITEWEKEELKAFKSSTDYFEMLLEDYYRELREIDSKAKLSTPYGKVTSRRQQPKWNYEDSKIIEWLNNNNKDLIRVKKEIDKAELKKMYKIVGNNVVTEDGEIVEGITIEKREDSINIKVVE